MLWREKNVKLTNGVLMPYIGLGTFRIKDPNEVDLAVNSAVKSGYKLIDTAAVYKNEALISSALKKYNIERKDLFLTSKLAPRDQGQAKASAAVIKSLENLDTSYIDLYLIHWPGASGFKVVHIVYLIT